MPASSLHFISQALFLIGSAFGVLAATLKYGEMVVHPAERRRWKARLRLLWWRMYRTGWVELPERLAVGISRGIDRELTAAVDAARNPDRTRARVGHLFRAGWPVRYLVIAAVPAFFAVLWWRGGPVGLLVGVGAWWLVGRRLVAFTAVLQWFWPRFVILGCCVAAPAIIATSLLLAPTGGRLHPSMAALVTIALAVPLTVGITLLGQVVLHAAYHRASGGSPREVGRFLILQFFYPAAYMLPLSLVASFTAIAIGHAVAPADPVPDRWPVLAVNFLCDLASAVVTLVALWIPDPRDAGPGRPLRASLGLPLRIGMVLAITGVLAFVSLYLGALVSSGRLSVAESLDVLRGVDVPGASRFGPRFWLAHTTFLPILAFLSVTLLAWLAKLLTLPVAFQARRGGRHKHPLEATSMLFAIYAAVFLAAAEYTRREMLRTERREERRAPAAARFQQLEPGVSAARPGELLGPEEDDAAAAGVEHVAGARSAAAGPTLSHGGV